MLHLGREKENREQRRLSNQNQSKEEQLEFVSVHGIKSW